MTLVSDIIRQAYRKTNIIPLGVTPSANQIAEALELLNPILVSTFGFEAGDELSDLTYGGDFDQSELTLDWIPDNARLLLNLDAAADVDADPSPYEGQRMAIADVLGNLATYNFVINGNGRKIEGAASVTLNTNNDTRQWMYRGDTGNWVKIEALEAADEMPLPLEFDTYFITMLALSLNPAYGQVLSPETVMELKRTRSLIRGRFRNKSFYTETDPGLVDRKGYSYGMRSFNLGRPSSW